MHRQHISFIDFARIFACIMVIIVHACEFYYIGDDGLQVRSHSDGVWVTVIDSMFRCAVPLFVMISGYLLLPIATDTVTFFRRRLVRVVVPFIFWVIMYATLPALWSDFDAQSSLARLLTNFSDNAGHLWFVYMIVGVYLIMPVISPWLERCSRAEERAYLIVWAISLFFPYIRYFNGYIYGEGSWNEFNTLWYFSGFLGYAVLAHYVRRYVNISRSRSFAIGIPLILVGYVITAEVFYHMLSVTTDLGTLELSWRFCTPNVAMVSLGFFLIFRNCTVESAAVRSTASLTYGIYLMHIFVLTAAYGLIAPYFNTPIAIILIVISTFVTCVIIAKCLSFLPYSKYILG